MRRGARERSVASSGGRDDQQDDAGVAHRIARVDLRHGRRREAATAPPPQRVRARLPSATGLVDCATISADHRCRARRQAPCARRSRGGAARPSRRRVRRFQPPTARARQTDGRENRRQHVRAGEIVEQHLSTSTRRRESADWDRWPRPVRGSPARAGADRRRLTSPRPRDQRCVAGSWRQIPAATDPDRRRSCADCRRRRRLRARSPDRLTESSARREPIGSRPGQNRRAASSLIITTGAAPVISAVVIARPRLSGMRSAVSRSPAIAERATTGRLSSGSAAVASVVSRAILLIVGDRQVDR